MGLYTGSMSSGLTRNIDTESTMILPSVYFLFVISTLLRLVLPLRELWFLCDGMWDILNGLMACGLQ